MDNLIWDLYDAVTNYASSSGLRLKPNKGLGKSSSFIRYVCRSFWRGVLTNIAVEVCWERTGPASFTQNYFPRFFAKYTRNGHRQKRISKP
jgi:hypothetical protein